MGIFGGIIFYNQLPQIPIYIPHNGSKSYRFQHIPFQERLCPCGLNVPDTISHIIVQCAFFEDSCCTFLLGLTRPRNYVSKASMIKCLLRDTLPGITFALNIPCRIFFYDQIESSLNCSSFPFMSLFYIF